MISLDSHVLRQFWPHASPAMIDAMASASAKVFSRFGIDTPLRAAHFMAQISHESGGGTITEESLNYTHAERVCEVWPTRFHSPDEAEPYVRNARALANKVYNGRMGNRAGSDDGFNYRGRGPLQLTGRDSYRDIGARIGLPLEEKPELAAESAVGLEIAACEFQKLGCLPFCDADNVDAVTRRVNGGYIGLAQRKAWLARWRQVDFEGAAPHVDVPGRPVPPEPHPEPLPPPAPPTVPRGSDDHLPPGTDDPGKTMAGSKTGWAAILATATAVATQLGQLVDQIKPLVQDERTIVLAAAVAAAAGLFIWFDRRKRLMADHV